MAANGFKVHPSELTAAAQRLAARSDGLTTLRGEVAAVPLPPAAFSHVPGAADLRSALNRCVESVSFDLDGAAAEVRRVADVTTLAADTYARTDAAIAERYRTLFRPRRVRHH